MANTEELFTPSQLASAVRRQDTSKGKRSYASGKALLQKLSDAAVSVLPPKYPDSGTAGRGFSFPGVLATGGLGASAVLNPAATATGTLAYLSTAIPYMEGPAKAIAKRLIDGKQVSPQEMADVVRQVNNIKKAAVVGGTRVTTDESRE